ncbi:MAG: hypothetical protein IT257_08835 [Chitinophagaceae bacterium]|nr:hypothetical protein [Chitinophagaceae bacterium]
MKFEEIIKSISDDFTRAWNEWDIDRLMTHLANNVEIYSPKIKAIYPDNTECKLTGKQAIKDYWTNLKNSTRQHKVVQTSLQKIDREITTINKVIGENITIHETFVVNEYGKIEYLRYEYI